MSIAEDSVPDFLTKFGLITHLIDDVNNFRAQVKSSRSRQLDRAAKAQSDEDLVRFWVWGRLVTPAIQSSCLVHSTI